MHSTVVPGSGQRRHAEGRNHLKAAAVEERRMKRSRVMHSEEETAGTYLSVPPNSSLVSSAEQTTDKGVGV